MHKNILGVNWCRREVTARMYGTRPLYEPRLARKISSHELQSCQVSAPHYPARSNRGPTQVKGRWGDGQAVAAHLAHGRLDPGSLFQVYAESASPDRGA